MDLRSAALFLIVFGALPFVLRHPYMGMYLWVWLGTMNPHRLTWGPAYNFPFAMVVAAATLLGLLVTRDERRLKGGAEAYALAGFAIWMVVTTLFALNPDGAVEMFSRAIKVQIMTFVALILLGTRKQINTLVWVLAISLGFYGIKGGVFTLLGGGQYRVWGPEGSAIEDNNSLAVAVIMLVPLLYYLLHETRSKWIRLGLVGAVLLSVVSALGSQSRGGLLAMLAMGLFLWWKSPGKLVTGLLLVLLVAGGVMLMPETWWARMDTISTYEADASAMDRLIAWKMLTNLAVQRPLVGGGFDPYTVEVYARYATTEWYRPQTAHSIYFQVLGEQGFVGFALFLLVWLLTWRSCSKIRQMTRDRTDYRWAHLLASMVQVSLVGYAVGGAFLSLAYWDFPYYLLVLVVITRHLVQRQGVISEGRLGTSASPMGAG